MSASPVVHLSTAEKMDRLIAGAVHSAPWMLPVFRRCRAGTLAYAGVMRGYRVPFNLLSGLRPTLVTIGDDDFAASGPSGWKRKDLRQLLRWGRAAFVFAGGGVAEAYDTACILAERTDRCVIIETDEAHISDWVKLLAATGTPLAGMVLPRPGGKPEVRH